MEPFSNTPYSIYWAGTALPPAVPSNLDPEYNREGGPRLAAFDRALELQTAEAGTDPRRVWASHSAGSAMTGTGEKQGMVLDAHVYVAPAGPAMGVDRTYGVWGAPGTRRTSCPPRTRSAI